MAKTKSTTDLNNDKKKKITKVKTKINKIQNTVDLDFLSHYLNTPSPTGFEYTGQKVWLDYISKYVDTTFVDTYGTAVAVINPDASYKVVIEAHADEISRFVNHIDDKGYINVIRNG